MAVSGGNLIITRQSACVNADGSALITLTYTNAVGAVVHARNIFVAADDSRVTDQFGTVLAAPVPAALANAINTFATQLDNMIANASATGKLNL